MESNRQASCSQDSKAQALTAKLLVIEDSPTFSEMLVKSICAVHAFECVKAQSFAQAKELLEKQGEQFFCATIDINLPDACGVEVVEYIAEHYSHIASIVLTGELSHSLREDVLALNVADYVLKNNQCSVDYVANRVYRLHRNCDVKVLVVDDSATARHEMRRLLDNQRFQSFCAASGKEAIQLLEEHADTKLCIIDCFMEGMNGLELAAKIRESFVHEEMAIVGVSGMGGQSMTANFIKSGGDDFLMKPFLTEEFYCRVNQNLDFIDVIARYKEADALKNTLLGAAAHDIRAPIIAIREMAALLSKPGQNTGSRPDQFVDKIVSSADAVLSRVDELLTITTIEQGSVVLNVESTSLAEMIHERIAFHAGLAECKAIHLHASLAVVSKILCDPQRISQVIDHLLNNAIKYSSNETDIHILLEEKDGWQQVEIIDEGCGVDEQHLSSLFNGYKRLDRQNTASQRSSRQGYGLLTSKQLIEAHQGKIGYQRADAGGSCFYFALPIT